MKVFLKKTICTEKVSIDGMTEENLEEHTLTISWRDTVYSHGRMAVSMWVVIKMIRNADTVLSSGQMGESTLEPGKTVNSMVKEFTSTEMEEREKAPGKMVKELIGLIPLLGIND